MFIKTIAQIIVAHSEFINLRPYPRKNHLNHTQDSRLMQKQLILNIADVVDSLMSARPYRSAYSESETKIKINESVIQELPLLLNELGLKIDLQDLIKQAIILRSRLNQPL